MGLSQPSNPGPRWGFRTIHWWDQHLPRSARDAMVWLGSAVACLAMARQRNASREYLEAVLERPVTRREQVQHFAAFTHSLLAKLRAANGPVNIDWQDAANRETGDILHTSEPILLGTFHVGPSDLLGFQLERVGRRVTMIRQRVGNSEDIERLIDHAGGAVEILWVNDESEMVFALRDALEAGKTLAMQCDRIEHASKTEVFSFLGSRRRFPVTIYRLASLYRRPVLFTIAAPAGENVIGVLAHEPFIPTGNRRVDRSAAHAHFQSVLAWLEAWLRENPWQWFNFLPLNPVDKGANPHPCSMPEKTREDRSVAT